MNQPHASSENSSNSAQPVQVKLQGVPIQAPVNPYPGPQIVPDSPPEQQQPQGLPYQYPQKIPAYQYPEKYSDPSQPEPEPEAQAFPQPEPHVSPHRKKGQQAEQVFVQQFPEQQFVPQPYPTHQQPVYQAPEQQMLPGPFMGYYQQEPIPYQNFPAQMPPQAASQYQQVYQHQPQQHLLPQPQPTQAYPPAGMPVQYPGGVPQWAIQEPVPFYEQQGYYDTNQMRPVGFERAQPVIPPAPQPAPKNELRVQFSHSMKPVVTNKASKSQDLLTVFATILLIGTVLVLVLLSMG